MEPEISKGLLQTDELYKYILETNVYPREHEALKQLRALTATHPRDDDDDDAGDDDSDDDDGDDDSDDGDAGDDDSDDNDAGDFYQKAMMGTAPDAGQMISILLKLIGAKRTIEIGVFTGYSLLLTALAIPDDGKIVAIDVNRESYEIGLPVIKNAGVEHKIDFIKSEAILALDKLLEIHDNEGSFDYAFVDADKINYINYHEKIMKLLKVNGVVVYDNTLWFGSVAQFEDSVIEKLREGRANTIKFNQALVDDPRIDISMVPLGDGITICRRLY